MKITIYTIVCLLNLTLLAQSNIASEEILLMNDSIKLPGTLTYDKNIREQPLVIFVHGSGNVDRNGNQAGVNANANYIKQLSDSLTERGIAFYRYDKRTATLENLKFAMNDLNFNRFVEDVDLAINHFKNDSRFSSMSLIGHSQGSLVGMLATKSNIKKFISLAGPSDAFDVVLIKQVRTQNGDSIANIVENHFKQLKEKGSIDTLDPNLAGMFSKPNQTFFTSWIEYIPSEEIKKVKIPVLIINGDKDLQVMIEDANVLHQASNGSELKIIQNMNHVLKDIEKDEDNIKSYTSSDYPLSSELINVIEEFIKN